MNSLVNNEKQSHCIYHTTHTHQKKKTTKHTRNNTLTLVATVCVKKHNRTA